MRNAIGIDVGGTKIRAARIAADGTISAHRAMPTVRRAEAILAGIEAMVAELRDAGTVAIGAGVPCRVDAPSGKIFSGGFVDLSMLPLAEALCAATQLAVVTDNDANMALAAEAQLGAACGARHAVMLTIGTGIGGAILDDGRIFHGGGIAGQLGHITINMRGLACHCGRVGCLETESSGTALARHMAAHGVAAGTPAASLLASDDAATRAVIADWILPLRAGIDSLVASFAPEIIILGGGLGSAAALALERAPAASPWFQCPIAAATLGDAAGVIGAGLVALGRSP